MNTIPIIIDCDPGIDDAFALFFALSQDTLDIKLVTAVSGNVSVEKTTNNLCEILRLANKQIRVAKGASRPLFSQPWYAEDVHGVNGLGHYQYIPDDSFIVEENAVDSMIDILKISDNKITIVTLGPLTNIATLLTRYPESKQKIERISIMGGGLKGGNVNIAAEFNIFVDPEAASIVFDSGINMIMAGLDVTERSYIESEHIQEISTFGVVGSMLNDTLGNTKRYNLHDVVPVMALTNPTIFKGVNRHVYVETSGVYTRGLTIADQRFKGRSLDDNVYILLDVDLLEFRNTLLKGLSVFR